LIRVGFVAQAFRPAHGDGSPEGLRYDRRRAALKGCATTADGQP